MGNATQAPLALVLLGAVAASAFSLPAAADDLPVGEQNRRAVYAGLFALSAEFHGALPGNTSSRRVPASGMSVIGAALTQAYEDAPWLDPDDAALVFGKALEASGCTKPCVPVEQSATQMLRRAESWVRDPANIPAAQRQEAFVYANAIAAVAEDLGAGASKDPLKNPLIVRCPPKTSASAWRPAPQATRRVGRRRTRSSPTSSRARASTRRLPS